MADVKPVKAGWFNVFRSWTLHGAVVPVLIGGAVAYADGEFCWWIFLLVLAGGCLLQSASNILNTYGDFAKGTDTVDNETRSPELVTGALSPKKVFLAGMACLGITAAIGLVLIWHIGWGILWFGIAGIAGAGLYTVGVAYKYHGMGQICCFILMGLLMHTGTYYAMAGTVTWEAFLLGLPNAFLITSVLSGNEMRDYWEDRKAGVGTLSGHMTYAHSMMLYRAEGCAAYVILAAIIIAGAVPWTCALAFAALWDLKKVLDNSKLAPTEAGPSRLLVPMAFSHNWHFGVLLTAGYLIGYFLL
ncbi:1,4-dihydroxy-2-naphthoate octaprenyltransferase [Methanomassiliicoccales archaeon LGM-DZ1]|nr:1,4-dihydroxy-2-naphthoate octaprenyltransferase [Methanomassiliicoccales archaeon LGM-DZ1]